MVLDVNYSLMFSCTNVYMCVARKQIIICTTSIISGNRIIDAAIEKGSLGKRVVQEAA